MTYFKSRIEIFSAPYAAVKLKGSLSTTERFAAVHHETSFSARAAAGAEKMMLTVAFEAACFSRLAPLPRIRSYSRSDLVHDWACSVKDTWAKNKMKSLAGWILFSLRPHTHSQPAAAAAIYYYYFIRFIHREEDGEVLPARAGLIKKRPFRQGSHPWRVFHQRRCFLWSIASELIDGRGALTRVKEKAPAIWKFVN